MSRAVGYHWHPPFTLYQIPSLIDKEIQRGRMGVLFYQKHPTWEVRMMIQMTWLHRLLWGILSLNGTLNEHTMAPFLQWLINLGKPQFALEIARIFLNWYNVKGVYAAYAEPTKTVRGVAGKIKYFMSVISPALSQHSSTSFISKTSHSEAIPLVLT